MTVPSTPLENHNHGPSKTLTRSFRDVAAQALPPRAYRNNPNSKSRITISLGDTIFRPITDLENQRPAIHRNSSYKHAVFYFVEKEFLNLLPEFQKARNVRFPFGTCLGTHATDDSQGKIIEVILNDQAAVDDAVNTPIVIGNDRKFHATPAVPQDNIILKVHLSKLPFLPVADLHATLVDNFSRFGNVRDVTIYLDDESNTAFCGNGAIFLDRSIDHANPKAWDKLTYKIDLGSKSFCLGKWAKMEPHCVYCKQMGHTRKDCQEIPTISKTCYLCDRRGHLARHCPRSHDNSIASSKKRVRNEEDPFMPNLNKVLINPTRPTGADDTVEVTGIEPNPTGANSTHEEARDPRPSHSITLVSDNESMMDVSEDDADRLTDAEELLTVNNTIPTIAEEKEINTASIPKIVSSKVVNSAINNKRVSPRTNKGVAAVKYDPSSSSPTSSFRKTSA
ncbi:hypothetical protein INT47_005413 [Mucor saturninus]|uniref:CCHC-type domain-containing protein n=1 Tax=Mucor saturninus TaxID=64648 RepID=A0A8H7V0D3_9FUNG|nr:hypothetical protein INT47_005413 [Mucor saturninus]